MKVIATMGADVPLAEVAAHARRVESLGYEALSVPEAQHDGTLKAQVVEWGSESEGDSLRQGMEAALGLGAADKSHKDKSKGKSGASSDDDKV